MKVTTGTVVCSRSNSSAAAATTTTVEGFPLVTSVTRIHGLTFLKDLS